MDEVLFLPFRVQTFLALTTATLVGLCAGLPFAFAGALVERARGCVGCFMLFLP